MFFDPVLNPSFELGTLGGVPTSWNHQLLLGATGTGVKTDEEARDGGYSLQIIHTNNLGVSQVYQNITVIANKKYTFRCWVKSDYSGDVYDALKLDCNNASTFLPLGRLTLGKMDISHGRYVEFEVYVPTGVTSVQINLQNQTGQSSAAVFYIDDISFTLSSQKKRYLYKVYDSSGNYIKTWDDVVFSGNREPVFSSSINFGCGELTVRLARSSNIFGEGEDIDYMNEVRVLCFDGDAPQGVVVFSGFISKYNPAFEGKKEYIDVTILGFAYEFQQRMYANGMTTTLTHSSVSPQAIFKDILDKFQVIGGKADYDGSSTDNPGTTVSYTFNTSTVKEALDKVLELSPNGWYYRVDPADNIVYYREKSSGADHTFIVGRDIISIFPEKSSEPIINEVWFTGGEVGGTPLFRYSQASGSKTAYGTRARKINDDRVIDSDTADIMAASILDALSSPLVRTRVRIMDSNSRGQGQGYDIESIKVGQTAKILGYTKKGSTLWDQAIWDSDSWDYDITNIAAVPQQIMRIQYTPNYVDIELSNRQPEISRRIEDIKRNMQNIQTKNNPSAATAV
jgi:hypothetical protein